MLDLDRRRFVLSAAAASAAFGIAKPAGTLNKDGGGYVLAPVA